MRKLITLGMLIGIALSAGKATAGEVTVDGIIYTVDEKYAEAYVSGYSEGIQVARILDKVSCEGMEYPVTIIDDEAFSGCVSLSEVHIPSSVTSVRSSAFRDCTAMTDVHFHAVRVPSVSIFAFSTPETIMLHVPQGRRTAYQTYFEWRAMTFNAIIDDLELEADCVADNIVYNISDDGIAYVSSWTDGLQVADIPEEVSCEGTEYPVTAIEYSAFEDCTGLTEAIIPNSVTFIDYNAFSGCTGLKRVSLPSSITEIRLNTFEECSNLTEVTIPNSVTKLGPGAFHRCTGLTEVTIPESVIWASGAFMYCKGLKKVTILGSGSGFGNTFEYCSNITDVYCYAVNPPTLSSDTFDSPETKTLHVVKGCKQAYEAAEYWCNFNPIVEDLEEGGLDGVSDIRADGVVDEPVDIYDMQGKCLIRGAVLTDVDALVPGFYIIDGRKVYVK